MPKSAYLIKEVDGAEHRSVLDSLQTLILPDDTLSDVTLGRWWIAYHKGDAVAFGGMKTSSRIANAIYLCRAGVLSGHRGQGLQRRLIQKRVEAARKMNVALVVTDTYDNVPSSNNLIDTGFRMFKPTRGWCANREGVNYWKKTLQPL